MVAADTDDMPNKKENDPMPTDQNAKGREQEGTQRKARKSGSQRGAQRAEGSSASRAFEFMRTKLNRDAEHVSERDIRQLRTTVPEKLETLDTKALRKELEWVGEMVGRVRTLWDMLFDREFVVDWKSKALVGAALLYFVLPADLTPDFIPGIGYIDDALVLATLWRLLQEKIDEYLDFKHNAGRRSPSKKAAARTAATGGPETAAAG